MSSISLDAIRVKNPTPMERAALVVSVLGSLAYFLHPILGHNTGHAAVKALGVGALAVLAFLRLQSLDGRILGFSLVFSTLGDIFLNTHIENAFVFGLGSFLIAHLIYVGLFVRHFPKPLAPGGAKLGLIGILILYSASMAVWLWPDLGDLSIPVILYLSAITAMGITSILAGFKTWWIAAGAILFIISDSMIALGRFKSPVPYDSYLVWGTYYAGQYFIAAGFLGEMKRG